MNLARSIATVGAFTLMSRVLGFVRDILIAAILGAGLAADVFFVAFKFPNLFRRLFAEGAFNLAFVPLFAGILEEDGRDAAKEFADQALAVLLWALLVFVVVLELAMPWAMMGLAPGFLGNPHKFQLAVDLTRITFPYLLFISLVSLMAGALNGLGRFAAAAAAPILLNITLVGSLVFFHDSDFLAGRALSHAVTIAGIAAAAPAAIFVPFDRTPDATLPVIGSVSKGVRQSLFTPGLGSSLFLGDFFGQVRVRLCEPRKPVVDITRVG